MGGIFQKKKKKKTKKKKAFTLLTFGRPQFFLFLFFPSYFKAARRETRPQMAAISRSAAVWDCGIDGVEADLSLCLAHGASAAAAIPAAPARGH